jgi:hypothetical protein
VEAHNGAINILEPWKLILGKWKLSIETWRLTKEL